VNIDRKETDSLPGHLWQTNYTTTNHNNPFNHRNSEISAADTSVESQSNAYMHAIDPMQKYIVYFKHSDKMPPLASTIALHNENCKVHGELRC
jgi:hypothetical protein